MGLNISRAQGRLNPAQPHLAIVLVPVNKYKMELGRDHVFISWSVYCRVGGRRRQEKGYLLPGNPRQSA